MEPSKIREERDTGRIGFPFQGRSSQRYFQRVTEFARDRIFPGARMDFDREGRARERLVKQDHETDLPQRARKQQREANRMAADFPQCSLSG